MHIKDLKAHREVCPFEPVICDECYEVTMPRHQINHHKNENCSAKMTCPRCQCVYNKREKHGMEECIAYLASMVKKLQDEKEKSSGRLDGK